MRSAGTLNSAARPYDSLQPHVRTLTLGGVEIRTLDIEGLLKTKSTGRDKDEIDTRALSGILERLRSR